jgi:hypothetical protein
VKVLACPTKKATEKAGKLRQLDTRERHKLRVAVKKCAMAAIPSKICSSATKRESVCHGRAKLPLLAAADEHAAKFAHIRPYWT